MSKIKTLLILEKLSQFEKFKNSPVFKNLLYERDIHVHYAHCIVPCLKFDYLKNKDRENSFKSDYNNSYLNLNKEFLLTFEDLIFSVYIDNGGAYFSNQELFFTLGEDYRNYFKKIYVIDINNPKFHIVLEEMHSSEKYRCLKLFEFDNLIGESSVKRYVDYYIEACCNLRDVKKNVIDALKTL